MAPFADGRGRVARAVALLLGAGALLAVMAALGRLSPLVDVGPLLRAALVLVATAALGAAAWLWRRRPDVGGREAALVIGSVALAVAMLEGGLRLRARFADTNGNAFDRLDDTLGWTLRSGVRGRSVDGGRYHSTADGLRARVNAGAARRVLVVGDSYTQAVQVDDDSTYWARLSRARPDLEFVVMGVGGYGTLQELMQIERLAPREHPDLIVWQLCGNDLVANDFELERRSLWDNNGMRRPYLEHDTLAYRDPSATAFTDRSMLARVLAGHLRVVRSEQLRQRSIEQELPDRPAELARALATTRALYARAASRVGAHRVLAFSTTTAYPSEPLGTAARGEGFAYANVADSVDEARRRGADVARSTTDAHWNARGHAIASRVLLRMLETLLPVQPPPHSESSIVTVPAHAH